MSSHNINDQTSVSCLKNFYNTVPNEILIETLTYLPLAEMGSVLSISQTINKQITTTPRYIKSIFVGYCASVNVPRSTTDTHLKTIEKMTFKDAHDFMIAYLKEMVAFQKELKAKRQFEEMAKIRLEEERKSRNEKERLEREAMMLARRMLDNK
ncbi:hypothetical protein C9374_009563 [Naegleria lovaniensis]|uniref:F-box domain-containing protein n=1 Tax=Naegleria lovaniensis TaxID=51637 RepID=A0AA88H325_NAELO|nr:uncharacterized protein C9374_009563 [Naegleria lovaniensis]KAG2392986.1 hypothetical protein C9374_009563 [Naegleria lovaniensis]